MVSIENLNIVFNFINKNKLENVKVKYDELKKTAVIIGTKEGVEYITTINF